MLSYGEMKFEDETQIVREVLRIKKSFKNQDETVKEALNQIDLEAEQRPLTANEILKRKTLTARQLKAKESRDFSGLGMGNRTLHFSINRLMAANNINGLQVAGGWIE